MATPPTLISPGPPVPHSNDPETTFDDMSEAFATWEKDELQPKANALAQGVYDNTVLAESSSAAAAAAAVLAAAAAASAVNAPGTSATSATSLSLTMGAKAWTIQPGKAFPPGQPIYLAYRLDPSKSMFGYLLTHDPATGACTSHMKPLDGVSGTYADWIMGIGVAPPSTATRGAGGASASGNTTLTAASAGVQRITPTGPGQWIQEADATTMAAGTAVREYSNAGAWDVEIRDATGAALGYILPDGRVTAHLVSNATAAGVWDMQGASAVGAIAAEINLPLSLGTVTTGQLVGAVSIDANRELLLLAGDTRLYGVVWDAASSVFGVPVLIRSANVGSRVRAINTAPDQMMVVSCDATTALQAVAFPVTGTTIGTLGTVATATLSGNMSSIDDLIAVVGQGFVVAYRQAVGGGMRALTVTGTTVAIGAESLTAGDNTAPPMLYDIGSSKVIVVDTTTATTTVGLRTVAGTTLTPGTAATLAITSTNYVTRMLGSGRVAVIYRNASNLLAGAIVSVSGTVVTNSVVALTATTGASPSVAYVVGSQVIVGGTPGGASMSVNVLTDNAGTAVAGTELVRDQLLIGPVIVAADATSVTVLGATASTSVSGLLLRLGVSGNNPNVLAARYVDAQNYADGGLSRPSSITYGKDTLPGAVLRGSSACVAGLTNTASLVWVSRGGMPQMVAAQPLSWPQGGMGRVRSMSNNWEWVGRLVQTGLTVAVQKLKVA